MHCIAARPGEWESEAARDAALHLTMSCLRHLPDTDGQHGAPPPRSAPNAITMESFWHKGSTWTVQTLDFCFVKFIVRKRPVGSQLRLTGLLAASQFSILFQLFMILNLDSIVTLEMLCSFSPDV